MRTFESVADLAAIKGESIGESEWVTISQEARPASTTPPPYAM